MKRQSSSTEKLKENKVSIGGQAVLEGIMMRGKSSMATAVRDADGIIRLETKRLKAQKDRPLILRLPLIRGVVSFVQSLFGGTAILMRSAEVYGEGEPSKFEKWLAEKLKVNIMNVVSFISVVLALFLAVFLFMWLPQVIRGLLERIIGEKFTFNIWAKNFIEGGIKLLIFIGYILLCSAIKDVRRTFMYHGAEHKTISCYEKGLSLTVENAKKCPRVHDRCGTTFMVFVLVISILAFALFESLVGQSINGIVRVLCKIALLPLVAGLSYELLKGLAKTDCFLVYPLKVPGLLLQKLTTKEPDDKMLEVAITAFNMVLEMDKDSSIPERQFVVAEKRKELTERVKEQLKDNGIVEEAEAEWIVSITLNIKRDEVYTDNLVTPKYVEQINDIVSQRITGRPLWYCIGDTEFYGYTIKTDERALIPRPETELLVEQALKYCNKNTKVLDLCTGSGAIAIAVNKESGALVTATDISEKALCLAKENAELNNAKVTFCQGDMFSAIGQEKFDLIISNPPYIKSEDINALQKEIKEFEPITALDGGADGLNFYREIANNVKNCLTENGVLLLEIGYNQAQEVKNLLTDFNSVEIIKDYDNNDRIIKAVL